MLEGISERVKKLSEGVFTSGSRLQTAESISEAHSSEHDLLIAVIILGIIVFALILIIIYGYCKYVRGGEKKMESRSVPSQATGDVEQQPPSEPIQVAIPVKTRKRSMTFSETDEECRKYREDLADSYNKPLETVQQSGERSRKKSVVTFAGVQEIDSNDA